jgi:hypothetical protein
MTPLANFSAALHLLAGLVALWLLVFKFVADYRIDALRDRLFAVREKLFDYAAQGGISFDDPAYTKLRMLINGLIRFAHRLTFMRFAMGVLFMEWRDQPCDKKLLVEWREALNALPPEASRELRDLHGSAIVLVVRHLVTGSPLMLALLLCFSVWALLNGFAKRLMESFADHLPGLDVLEAQTLNADAEERTRQEEIAFANR